MEVLAVTDVGRQRKNNEDSYFIYQNDRLSGGMVADGIGGHDSGEVASRIATDLIKQYIITKYNPKMDYMEITELIRTAFVLTNQHIYQLSKKSENKGMGTTATLALVYDGKLIIAHVGDSRCYEITDNGIEQITDDHSYVNELVKAGQISETAAYEHPNRNVITRALGTDIQVRVDMCIRNFDNQTVLLCTDGLSNMLSDSQIESLYRENTNLNVCLEKMVELANKKGGNDNITAVSFRRLKGVPIK